MSRTRKQRHLVSGLAGLALSFVPAIVAAKEVKYDVVSYVTRLEVKPVGDVEGHVAGPWERRGLCLFPKDEVAVYVGAGTIDATKGKGTVKGVSTCTFEDGSSITTEWTLRVEPGPKGLAVYKDGQGVYVAGTGRFQGIKGTLTFAGKAYTPYKDETKGDTVMSCDATYTVANM